MRIDLLCSTHPPDFIADLAAAVGGRIIRLEPGDVAGTTPPRRDRPELLDGWRQLLEDTGQGSRFNDPGLFESSLRTISAGRPQRVVVLFSGPGPRAVVVGSLGLRKHHPGAGRLSGALPALRVLRIPQAAIVTDSTSEAISAVGGFISAAIASGAVDCAEIGGLDADGQLQMALIRRPDRKFRHICKPQTRFYLRLIEPGTGKRVAIGSTKSRQQIRRRRRNLEALFDGDLEFVRVDGPDRTDWFLQCAARIADQTYQSSMGIGLSDTPEMREYLRALAEAGFFRGYLLLGGGEPIAYRAGDLSGGIYHGWWTAYVPSFSKHGPGGVLLHMACDDLIGEGVGCIDFGTWQGGYKESLANEWREEIDIVIYGPGIAPTAAFVLHRGGSALRRGLRDTVERLGLLDRARKLQRDYLHRGGRS